MTLFKRPLYLRPELLVDVYSESEQHVNQLRYGEVVSRHQFGYGGDASPQQVKLWLFLTTVIIRNESLYH